MRGWGWLGVGWGGVAEMIDNAPGHDEHVQKSGPNSILISLSG